MQTSLNTTETANFLSLYQKAAASLYAFRKRIKQKPLLFLLDWVAIPLLFVTFLGFWDKEGSLELKLFNFGIVLLWWCVVKLLLWDKWMAAAEKNYKKFYEKDLPNTK